MRGHRAKWAARSLGRDRQVRAATDWLSTVPWTLWVSLTFRTLPSDARAQEALRAWLSFLARGLKAHIVYVWGANLRGNEGSHFHLLLMFAEAPSRETRRAMQAAWRGIHGFARIGSYRPELGGERYLLEHDEWNRGVACPRTQPRCRRKHGCAEDVGPWT